MADDMETNIGEAFGSAPPAEPTTQQRLALIEQSIQQQQALTYQMTQLLSTIATRLAPSGHKPLAKVNPPPTFDGNRANGRAFLDAAEVYVGSMESYWQDDQEKIRTICTYLRGGDAVQRFASQTMKHPQNNNGAPRFANWAAFVKKFEEEFVILNDKKQARTLLRGTSYFQGSDSVDTYVARFLKLSERAGHVDGDDKPLSNLEEIVTTNFRRGLNLKIEETISLAPAGPTDENLAEWIKQARAQEVTRDEHKSFHQSTCAPVAPNRAPFVPRAPIPFARHAPAPAPAPAPRPAPAERPLPPGIPMDVDTTRRRRAAALATVTCRRCGRTGHLSYNCPQPADVRALDENWVLSVDHAEEVAAYHAAHSDIVEQEARAAAMEDFGNGRE